MQFYLTYLLLKLLFFPKASLDCFDVLGVSFPKYHKIKKKILYQRI